MSLIRNAEFENSDLNTCFPHDIYSGQDYHHLQLDTIYRYMSHKDLQTSPLQLVALSIQDELKELLHLRKALSKHNQKVFSTDLALVAHGLRYVKD